jgi:AraC-like DNA-binding protein
MENNKHILITKACEYIENNLSEKITLAHLTNCTSYSERAIQLLFKKHFKLTPFEYIEEQRLLKAFKLIETHKQDKPVTQIAKDVGLIHLGRFSVKFKKRFGISPSQFARY